MNNHVPTKENCLALDKTLKAKGMKPMETMFWWQACPDNSICGRPDYIEFGNKDTAERVAIPAPLVSELGMVLPRKLPSKTISDLFLKFYQHQDGDWVCEYVDQPPYRKVHYQEYAPTEADARCLMLTYLINEGLISNK